MYTRRGRELARQNQAQADAFYDALLAQLQGGADRGRQILQQALE